MELINFVLQAGLGFILFMLLILLVFIQIHKYHKEKVMITHIPVPVELFKEMIYSQSSSIANNIKAGIPIEPIIDETARQSKELLNKFNSIDIDSFMNALSKPIQQIFQNILEIIEDGKYNLKDISETLAIASSVSEIAKAYPEIKKELSTLDSFEEQIILIALHTKIKEKIKLFNEVKGL